MPRSACRWGDSGASALFTRSCGVGVAVARVRVSGIGMFPRILLATIATIEWLEVQRQQVASEKASGKYPESPKLELSLLRVAATGGVKRLNLV